MVAIVRTEWSGTSGGPGLSQLAILGAAGGEWNPGGEQAAVNAVRAFWNSIAEYLPDEVQLRVSPVVDTYDRATGELVSSAVAATPPALVQGTSTGNYLGGAGIKVTWNTGQIANGRRVHGSTFIVPTVAAGFTVTGTVGSTLSTLVNTSAATLITALTTANLALGVWSRPRELPTPRAGFATEVTSGTVNGKSAILRGRRD